MIPEVHAVVRGSKCCIWQTFQAATLLLQGSSMTRAAPVPIASLATTFLGLLLAGPAPALTITLNPAGTLPTELIADVQGLNEAVFSPTALPFADTHSPMDIGGSTSESSYVLSNAGFLITFDHAIDDDAGDFALAIGGIAFTVDEDAIYDVTGTYDVIDSEGRLVRYQAFITNLDGTTIPEIQVFHSLQQSRTTPNESFTLGLEEGDDFNTLVGALSGTLFAGTRYSFNYTASLENARVQASTGASATGFFELSLIPVPEPSTGLLVALGLGGLAVCRRRH